MLFILAFPLLWWNEGRTVHRTRTLEAGEKNVVSVSSETVDAANEGKLIHTSGMLATDDVLEDSLFGIKVNAILLERTVEMYQWVEDSESKSEEKMGGSEETTTTYTYKKEWSSTWMDSSEFQEEGHRNPPRIPFEGKRSLAKNVFLGAFALSERIIGYVGGTQPYPIPNEYAIPAGFKNAIAYGAPEIRGNAIYFPYNQGEVEASSAAEPQIGDVRVSFQMILPHNFSIVAQQQGNGFVSYSTPNGDLLLTANEIQSAGEMFASAKSANKMLAWLLRLAGFLMMFVGIKMIFAPLRTLGAVIPFIGKIIGFGTGLVAFVIALPCTLITIAIAWIAYRPVLAIVLIAIAVGIVILVMKRKKANAPAA